MKSSDDKTTGAFQSLDVDKIFQTLKPTIKSSIDKLFTLFKEDKELFNTIIDKCQKIQQIDEDTGKIITPNNIRCLIMDYLGNTKENAQKIIQSSEPLYNIGECISPYVPPIGELTREYIYSYSSELSVNITGDKSEGEF